LQGRESDGKHRAPLRTILNKTEFDRLLMPIKPPEIEEAE
jgi:hypothetical protein